MKIKQLLGLSNPFSIALHGGDENDQHNSREQQRVDDWERREASNYANNRNNYNRAYAACLEGRGYTVK